MSPCDVWCIVDASEYFGLCAADCCCLPVVVVLCVVCTLILLWLCLVTCKLTNVPWIVWSLRVIFLTWVASPSLRGSLRFTSPGSRRLLLGLSDRYNTFTVTDFVRYSIPNVLLRWDGFWAYYDQLYGCYQPDRYVDAVSYNFSMVSWIAACSCVAGEVCLF